MHMLGVLYKGPPAPKTWEWRCVVCTNCLFSWAALNLIRPQTLMPYSPVACNGLSNAMKSLSLPARTPYVSGLMAWRQHRTGLTNVMAFVVASAGLLMRPPHWKGAKKSKPLAKSYTRPGWFATFKPHCCLSLAVKCGTEIKKHNLERPRSAFS